MGYWSCKSSGFPVGARWEAVAKNGARAWYWLESRIPAAREGEFIEDWHWLMVHPDGSAPHISAIWSHDHCTSRRKAVEELGYKKLLVCGQPESWPRFKRGKDETT